jgi:hypothetical protein
VRTFWLKVHDEEKRFTIPQIKAHAFFKEIAWEHLIVQTPPLSPLNHNSSSLECINNFERTSIEKIENETK